jgi:hypothetical protein
MSGERELPAVAKKHVSPVSSPVPAPVNVPPVPEALASSSSSPEVAKVRPGYAPQEESTLEEMYKGLECPICFLVRSYIFLFNVFTRSTSFILVHDSLFIFSPTELHGVEYIHLL